MLNYCSCDSAGLNVALSNCPAILGNAKGGALIAMIANDGSRNEWPVASTTFNKAWFDAIINNIDDSKKLRVLPRFENVATERAAGSTTALASGNNIETEQGLRTFGIEFPKADPTFAGCLEAFKCVEHGFVIFLSNNKMLMMKDIDDSGAEVVRQIEMNEQNLQIITGLNIEGNYQKVIANMEVMQSEKDSNLVVVDVAADVNLVRVRGLLDANIDIISAGTTQMVVKVTEKYGAINNKNVIKNLVIADFSLDNVTDTASVAITGVTYNATTGEHTLDYAAQDIADVLEVNVVKTGLDGVPAQKAVA